MPFNFDPESANTSWEPGQYEATITNTEEGATKEHGDKMLIVTYDIYHPNGQKKSMKDYFTAPPKDSGRPGNLFRLRSLCMAVGDDIYQAFKTGVLNHQKQLRGKNILLELVRKIDPTYGDQNKVKSYAKLERLSAVAAGAEEDDSIPF